MDWTKSKILELKDSILNKNLKKLDEDFEKDLNLFKSCAFQDNRNSSFNFSKDLGSKKLKYTRVYQDSFGKELEDEFIIEKVGENDFSLQIKIENDSQEYETSIPNKKAYFSNQAKIEIKNKKKESAEKE